MSTPTSPVPPTSTSPVPSSEYRFFISEEYHDSDDDEIPIGKNTSVNIVVMANDQESADTIAKNYSYDEGLSVIPIRSTDIHNMQCPCPCPSASQNKLYFGLRCSDAGAIIIQACNVSCAIVEIARNYRSNRSNFTKLRKRYTRDLEKFDYGMFIRMGAIANHIFEFDPDPKNTTFLTASNYSLYITKHCTTPVTPGTSRTASRTSSSTSTSSSTREASRYNMYTQTRL